MVCHKNPAYAVDRGVRGWCLPRVLSIRRSRTVSFQENARGRLFQREGPGSSVCDHPAHARSVVLRNYRIGKLSDEAYRRWCRKRTGDVIIVYQPQPVLGIKFMLQNHRIAECLADVEKPAGTGVVHGSGGQIDVFLNISEDLQHLLGQVDISSLTHRAFWAACGAGRVDHRLLVGARGYAVEGCIRRDCRERFSFVLPGQGGSVEYHDFPHLRDLISDVRKKLRKTHVSENYQGIGVIYDVGRFVS